MTVRRTARIAVFPGPRQPVEVREWPLPELEPDSALLRVELSEVCGTDVHLQAGRLAGVPYPIIPGHVTVGVLERVRGSLVDVDGRRLVEGDRVTYLDVHRTCHQCWYCLIAQATTRCPERKVYGITYGLADGLTGGWAEFVYLKPGVRVLRMGDVPSELYMAGGCSLPTALHAVERADVRLADTVLVLGSGPVGLSTIAFAVLRGALRVLCIGAPDHRLDQARTLGASETLNFQGHTADARAEWVRERTGGRGADASIECTGSPEAVVDAMRCTRDAGRVVVVGQYTDHGDALFNPHLDVNKKHLDVRGCWGSDYSHFHRGLAMLTHPRAADRWFTLPLRRFALTELNEALAEVASGHAIKALVDPWK